MHQYINSLTLLSDSPYAWKIFCCIQILTLQTLGYSWFIPSHYLEVDNYNKEKLMLWLQRNLLYSFEAPGTAYKRLNNKLAWITPHLTKEFKKL